MANRIRIKRSSVPGKIPLATDLDIGELAVNTADGSLYTKHSDGNIVVISSSTIDGNTYVAKTGDTMTGFLTLNADPVNALHAATKEYVDTVAATAIHYHTPVRVESPDSAGSLNATYNNGTNGVGATLTNNGTQAALVIDGVTLDVGDRVLIYKQTNAYENGIYVVTNIGSASTNWVLTRATDADSYDPISPDALGEGDAFFVKEGDTAAGELYVMNTSGTITFGTTPITFTQVSAQTIYSAGAGLDKNGTEFSHTDTSSVTNLSVGSTGGTVLQSISLTFDGFGHVTAASSNTTNLDTRYLQLSGGTLTGQLVVPAGAAGGIRFPNDSFGGSSDTASIKLLADSGEDMRMTFTLTNDANDKFAFVAPSNNGLLMNNNVVWHAGNDGTGSGLDADLLDGQQGSYYLDYNNFTNTPSLVFTTTDIAEGANLYYTDARVTALLGSTSVNALADVDTTSTAPNNGQALVWNGTNWVPGNVATTINSIDDIADVDTTTSTPATGEALVWNGTKWVPGIAGGNINLSTSDYTNIYNGDASVTNTVTLVDTISATGISTVKWFLTATDSIGGNLKASTVDGITDSTNIFYTEHGIILTNDAVDVAVYTANIAAGNINLYATGVSSSVNVKFQRVALGSSTPTGYIAGLMGYTGSAGADGVIGVDGNVGYTGSAGFDGQTGYTGSAGLNDWQPITGNYTAVDKDRLLLDTSGGQFYLTLPSSPSVGYYIQVTDASNLAANSVIVNPNGNTIEGFTDNLALDVPNSTMEFIFDGTTWQLTSTTGTRGDVGYTGSVGATGPIGYTGSTGKNFVVAKTYDSVANLELDTNPTGITSGEFAIIDTGSVEDIDNAKVYLWTGNAYTYITDLSGSAGITGATGPIGYTGSQGIQGNVGYAGSQGPIGYTGSAGQDGIIGVDGYTGSQGNIGYTGSAGIGYTGSQGNIGYTGSAGLNGYTGSLGYTGSSGLQTWVSVTGNYTASTNERLVLDSDAGSFFLTLPANPNFGDYIQATAASDLTANSVVVDPNGSTIESSADFIALDVSNATFEFIYDGTTWQITSTAGPRGATGYTGSAGLIGNIGDLGDVDTTTTAPVDGQALVWNSNSSVWMPGNVAASGGTAGNLEYSTLTYTGNAAANTFAVSSTATVDNILVTENGVLQTPTTDYVISNSTITFVETPAANVAIQIRQLPTTATVIGTSGSTEPTIHPFMLMGA